MSVSAGVQLPDQPTIGVSTDRALGGPGAIAPHSYQDCTLSSVSDASGGANTAHITTDPRWCSLFSFVNVHVASPAAAIPFTIDLLASDALVRGPSTQGDMAFNTVLGAHVCWYPCPFIGSSNVKTSSAADPFRVRVIIPNVDTETLNVHVRVYNFQKDITQRVPLSTLFAVLPRAGSLS